MMAINDKGLVLVVTYSINGVSFGEYEVDLSLNELLWRLTICYN